LSLAATPVQPPSRLRARVLAGARPPDTTDVVGAVAGEWQLLAPGIERRRLGGDAREGATTFLVRVAPGTRFPGGVHPHTEHCDVVAGSVRVGDRRLEIGDWVRVPAGTVGSGRAVSDDGCLLLLTELG
jgi:anti-sigma factor ChrR (cupin superfamily)